MLKKLKTVKVFQAQGQGGFRTLRRKRSAGGKKCDLLYVSNTTKSLHFESSSSCDDLLKCMKNSRERLNYLVTTNGASLINDGLSQSSFDKTIASLHCLHLYVGQRTVSGDEYKPYNLGMRTYCQLHDCCPECAFFKSRPAFCKMLHEYKQLLIHGYVPIFATLVAMDSPEELDLYETIDMFKELRGRRGKYDPKVVIDDTVAQCFYRGELAKCVDGYRHHIHAVFLLKPESNVDSFIYKLRNAWESILKSHEKSPKDAFLIEWSYSPIGAFKYTMTQPFAKDLTMYDRAPDLILMAWFKFHVKRKDHGLSRKTKGKLIAYQGEAKVLIGKGKSPDQGDIYYEEISIPRNVMLSEAMPFIDWANEISDQVRKETMPIDEWIAEELAMDRVEELARRFGPLRRLSSLPSRMNITCKK